MLLNLGNKKMNIFKSIFFKFIVFSTIEDIKIVLPSLSTNQKIIKRLHVFYRGIIKNDPIARKLKVLLDENRLLAQEDALQEPSFESTAEFYPRSDDSSQNSELEAAMEQEEKTFAAAPVEEVSTPPKLRCRLWWEAQGVFVDRKHKNKSNANANDVSTNTAASISATM